MSYILHSTFKNLPTHDLSSKQKRKLCKALTSLEDEEKKKAVFLLIAEHARLESGEIDIGNYIVPYEGVAKHDNISFNIEKIPISLKWILWKFMNIEGEN